MSLRVASWATARRLKAAKSLAADLCDMAGPDCGLCRWRAKPGALCLPMTLRKCAAEIEEQWKGARR